MQRDPNQGLRSSLKQILVFYNPISSHGHSKQLASSFTRHMEKQGCTVTLMESKISPAEYSQLTTQIQNQDAVIIVGGDGTLRNLLSTLSTTKKPVYMIPAGNESLFAKYYGMTQDFSSIYETLINGQILDQYFAKIHIDSNSNEESFYSMASMGFDSLTIKNIGKRTGPISDWTYIKSGIKSLKGYRNPTVTIEVNNEIRVQKESGYLIVANTPAYARNLTLVPNADPYTAELIVGFLPKASLRHEFIKLVHMMRQKAIQLPFQFFKGNTVTIKLHNHCYPLQVDGDYYLNRNLESGELLSLQPSASVIKVLCPLAR